MSKTSPPPSSKHPPSSQTKFKAEADSRPYKSPEQIADEIREDIRTNKRPPGSRLPKIEELSDIYKGTHHYCRLAIQQLQEEGVVISRRKAGTFVRDGHRRQNPIAIGLVTVGVNIPFVGALVEGICDHFESINENQKDASKRYRLIVASSGNDPRREGAILGEFIQEVRGLLIIPTRENHRYSSFTRFRDRKIPILLVDKAVKGIEPPLPRIGYDNQAVGSKLAENVLSILQKIGRQDVPVYLLSEINHIALMERVEGFRRMMKEARPEWENVRLSMLLGMDAGRALGEDLIQRLQQNHPAVIACTADSLAFGAMDAFQKAGLSIPGQVMVIGCDNDRYGEFSNPTLTSLHLDHYGLGKNAAKMLLGMLTDPAHEPANQLVTPGEIVRRQSSF